MLKQKKKAIENFLRYNKFKWLHSFQIFHPHSQKKDDAIETHMESMGNYFWNA